MRFSVLVFASMATLCIARSEEPPSLSDISAKISTIAETKEKESENAKEIEIAVPIAKESREADMVVNIESTKKVEKAGKPNMQQQRDELDILYDSIVGFERRAVSLDEIRRTADPFSYDRAIVVDGESLKDGDESAFNPRVSAILNNRAKIGLSWLYEGDMYEGWKLVSVGRSGIWLESQSGERRYYPINKSKVLQVEKR